MTPTTRRVLVDCTSELFRAYGVTLREAGHVTAIPAVNARDTTHSGCVIDLKPTGGELASHGGRLIVLSSFGLIANTRPEGKGRPLSSASAGDWIYVRDWTRELTNQLAGRITNRLTGAGVTLAPGLPRALSGDGSTREMRAAGGDLLSFAAGQETLHVMVVLPRELTSRPPPAPEGGVTWLDGEGDD